MSNPKSSREIFLMKVVDQLADQFEVALYAGQNPQIEDYLTRIEFAGRDRLLRELIRIEIESHSQRGTTFVPGDYQRRFPESASLIFEILAQGNQGFDSQSARFEEGIPALQQTPEDLPRRFGRFTLQRKLGSGGFGTVYLADDTRLGRHVAIKIPHPTSDPDGQRRFLTEARAAAKLSHANIVTVHDSDVIDDTLYIVSEFVDGSDLAQIIKERKPTLKQLITWLRQAALGLAHAHSQGVLHRDIKPSNILISQQGQVYLSDFGLARRIDDQSSLTASGTILGTPSYMAPEQAAGINASVGPASDQYSLGVVLYQVLTGRVPFRGNIQQVLQRVIRDDAPRPSSLNDKVPPALEAICLRTLAKNPAHRYPDLQAFADDLDSWLQGKSVSVEQATGWRAQTSKLVRSRTTILLVSALVIVLPVGITVAMMQMATGNPKPKPDKPQQRIPVEPQAIALAPQRKLGVADPAQLQRPDQPKAELAVSKRREILIAASSEGQAWEFPPFGDADGTAPLIAVFLSDQRQTHTATAVITDSRDDSRKSIWQGSITGVSSDPELRLEYEGGDLSLMQNARQLKLVVDNEGRPAWQNVRRLIPLLKAANPPKFASLDEQMSQLATATMTGNVFLGTLQYSGGESRPVKLTFTENRDRAGYVRALFEAGESPFIAAPFVGTIDHSLAVILGGRPIRLVRKAASMGVADEWPVFSRPWLNPEMHLSLNPKGDGLIGTIDDGKLKLTPAPRVEPIVSPTERWLAAVSPESVWTGSIRYLDTPPRRIRITVAETRDGLDYVRLMVEDAVDPHQFCIYEGAVNRSDDYIDGFAFSINRKTQSPTRPQAHPPARDGMFGYADELRHTLRLSPDGKSLFCRTACGEELTLVKSPNSARRKFDRESASELWKSTCQPTQEWEGTLRNKQFNQDTAIRLQFLTAPDTLGKVAVRCTLAEQPRIKMDFSGTLFLDGDVDPNAFALKLVKLGVGVGDSMVFGRFPEVKLQFRLSTDGTALIGMAGNADWIELMELTKAVSSKPATKVK